MAVNPKWEEWNTELIGMKELMNLQAARGNKESAQRIASDILDHKENEPPYKL